MIAGMVAVAMAAILFFPMRVEAVSAQRVILVDAQTGRVLYEKNADERALIASTTKIMTALIVCEQSNVLDRVRIPKEAVGIEGSSMYLREAEVLTVQELLYGLMLQSGNDAAVALAEHISGSEDAFVEQMNKRAKELKMNDTVFKNCNGLDEEGHITSANDVAIMSRELTKHEKIFDYTSIWLDNLRDGKTQIVNTNKLLKSYNGITGLKTGTTDDAGCCMSATAKRGEVSLISVVLGCKTGKERFSDAAILLDYGFANISVKELTLPEDMPERVKIDKGMENSVDIKCDISSKVVMDKTEKAEIVTNVELPETVEAPIEKGQILGKITYSTGDEAFEECDIVANDDVPKAEFGTVFAVVFQSMFAL